MTREELVAAKDAARALFAVDPHFAFDAIATLALAEYPPSPQSRSALGNPTDPLSDDPAPSATGQGAPGAGTDFADRAPPSGSEDAARHPSSRPAS